MCYRHSTIYRLTRRESRATLQGPTNLGSALEGACRLLNIVLRQKKNGHRPIG